MSTTQAFLTAIRQRNFLLFNSWFDDIYHSYPTSGGEVVNGDILIYCLAYELIKENVTLEDLKVLALFCVAVDDVIPVDGIIKYKMIAIFNATVLAKLYLDNQLPVKLTTNAASLTQVMDAMLDMIDIKAWPESRIESAMTATHITLKKQIDDLTDTGREQFVQQLNLKLDIEQYMGELRARESDINHQALALALFQYVMSANFNSPEAVEQIHNYVLLLRHSAVDWELVYLDRISPKTMVERVKSTIFLAAHRILFFLSIPPVLNPPLSHPEGQEEMPPDNASRPSG